MTTHLFSRLAARKSKSTSSSIKPFLGSWRSQPVSITQFWPSGLVMLLGALGLPACGGSGGSGTFRIDEVMLTPVHVGDTLQPGVQVRFGANASKTPDSWSWSLPEGTYPRTSTEASPELRLTRPGTWTGEVTATRDGKPVTFPFSFTVGSSVAPSSIPYAVTFGDSNSAFGTTQGDSWFAVVDHEDGLQGIGTTVSGTPPAPGAWLPHLLFNATTESDRIEAVAVGADQILVLAETDQGLEVFRTGPGIPTSSAQWHSQLLTTDSTVTHEAVLVGGRWILSWWEVVGSVPLTFRLNLRASASLAPLTSADWVELPNLPDHDAIQSCSVQSLGDTLICQISYDSSQFLAVVQGDDLSTVEPLPLRPFEHSGLGLRRAMRTPEATIAFFSGSNANSDRVIYMGRTTTELTTGSTPSWSITTLAEEAGLQVLFLDAGLSAGVPELLYQTVQFVSPGEGGGMVFEGLYHLRAYSPDPLTAADFRTHRLSDNYREAPASLVLQNDSPAAILTNYSDVGRVDWLDRSQGGY